LQKWGTQVWNTSISIAAGGIAADVRNAKQKGLSMGWPGNDPGHMNLTIPSPAQSLSLMVY